MNDNIFAPQRFESETQEQYRARQRAKQVELKSQRRGKVFWDSYTKGQYIKGM